VTKTREQWLQQAVRRLTPTFTRAGVVVPDVAVSVGWPGGRGKKANVIGQCWPPSSTADGRPAIFISPALTGKDPVNILATLTHELVHAVGCPGHKGKFVKLARDVGLVKPWTATRAGDALAIALDAHADKLGPFPHAAVRSGLGVGLGPEVQSTRMLKVYCPDDGYTLRTTRKWLDVAIPDCPVCNIQMDVEQKA